MMIRFVTWHRRLTQVQNLCSAQNSILQSFGPCPTQMKNNWSCRGLRWTSSLFMKNSWENRSASAFKNTDLSNSTLTRLITISFGERDLAQAESLLVLWA